MPASNTALRYGSVAMAFHWAIAALILANIGLALYFNELTHSDPNLFPLVQLHKSIGLTVLVLSVLRLVWRLANPVPPLPADMSALLKFGARLSHFLFYFFMIAIPLAGWAMVSSSPRGLPTLYFGLFQWPHISVLAALPLAEKRFYGDLFQDVHAYLAYSALALVGLHVCAALWHHYIHRDQVLRRMIPGTQVGPAT